MSEMARCAELACALQRQAGPTGWLRRRSQGGRRVAGELQQAAQARRDWPCTPSDLQPGAPQGPLLHISSLRAKILHILFFFPLWSGTRRQAQGLKRPQPELWVCCLVVCLLQFRSHCSHINCSPQSTRRPGSLSVLSAQDAAGLQGTSVSLCPQGGGDVQSLCPSHDG